MADRGDTHYRVPGLNAWFAVSSLVFLVACFWMVIDDWSRPWKTHQREFREIEISRGREALTSEDAEAVIAEEEQLRGILDAKKSSLAERQAEIDAAEAEYYDLRHRQFVITEAAKKAKQEFNWERYIVEEERLHHNDPDYGSERLKSYQDLFISTAGEKEVIDIEAEAADERLKELRSEVAMAEQAVKDAGKPLELTRSKMSRIAPEDAPTQIANVIRDFPGLDFIGPSLQVKKVVLEDLTFELNFLKKKRIDMCMTCHVPIDKGGYEVGEQPYVSHPRLDLYLTAKSPHPMSQFGCTICHRGSGEALDFIRTDHRPTDEAEGLAWHDESHWHKQHHWDYPMLRSGDIEASCVQCHKTSMELIADDAPQVTAGYRNFERFGCYACHKVDWFPTKRRPGPSLKGIREKTDPEFIASWVAAPRDFRPTTWMPQVFHLENFPSEEEVVTSEYGQGRPIMGQEWNDSMVASVTAYIWDNGETDDPAPIPVEGDSTRGAEVFRLSGCLACHNLAPYDGEPDLNDPALEPKGNNEHGPNLRGVATKVTPEWLFAWIKDPSAYWAETRMPDLRLPDQDIADIVAYMTEDPDGIFTDVPEGWVAEPSPYNREVLEELARWFYAREGRAVIADRFEGDWSEDRALLRAVGEKVILNQGCHSCHEIKGVENAMPIGTELTNWTSKTVDKLDWGFVPDQLAAEGHFGPAGSPESLRRKREFKHYREGWLAQKLHEPRSYDRGKAKSPLERLKMPWFDFTEQEVSEISTFVLGLVDDEVQRAKMIPTASQGQMELGLRAMRQNNCAACHVIAPGEVLFEDEDGVEHRVRAEMLALEDEVMPAPMDSLEDLAAYIADWEEYTEEELEEVGFRLLEPEPNLGKEAAETVFVAPDKILEIRAPWGGDFVRVVTDYYLNGQELYDEEADEYYGVTADPDGGLAIQDVDGEWRDYSEEPYDKVRWTFAPPVLLAEGHKLQKEWFYQFLLAPVGLREQVRVKMPTFNYGPGEAGAVADTFAHRSVLEWPPLFTRQLRLNLGLSVGDLAAEAGVGTDIVRQIERGDKVAIKANLPKITEAAMRLGFEHSAAVDPLHEHVSRRTPAHLAMAREEVGDTGMDLLAMGEKISRDGPQCFQCHFYQGVAPLDGAAKPLAWAPDLYRVRERLREDWVEEWLWAPSVKYPGTAMPSNFSPDPDKVQYREIYPDSSSTDQIQAVLDWLYNADRDDQGLQ